jgi:hypothetical protein
MSKELLEEFGRQLVLYGRDEGIQSGDLRNDRACMSKGAERWRAAATSTGGVVPTYMVIPDCIDLTIFKVLHAMDDCTFPRVFFTTSWGETIDVPIAGCGEPIGWYIGPREWRWWYSKERIVDADDIDLAAIKAENGTQDIPDDPAPNLDDLEMPRRAIEELGILLVRHVRDVAIQSCDLQLLPHSETPMAKRWRKAAIPHGGKVPPEVLIPDCVDETIYTFLRAIDQGLLPLSFVAENGETVDLTKVGNLAGRYIEPGGWRDQFSKERIGKD